MGKSLHGKVVLITGASSGFGAIAAQLFADEGCSVVLAARRIDRLQELAEQIQSKGGSALAVPVDVAERVSISGMMETVIEIYGHIDILFNNAGFGRLDWLENLSLDRDIETQINVNLLGLIEVTRMILPHMLERGSGHIINMSSVAGWIAAPTYSVYSATKFGVRGFTEALRREVATRGVQVSGIYPGPAATEFGQHTGKSNVKENFDAPAWTTMTAEYVAQQVVKVAKKPKRALILPGWFKPLIWVNDNLPWLADWIVINFFTKRFHKPSDK